MYNWNTDTVAFPKKDDQFAVWKLNQTINFGLHGEKLDFTLVKKYWHKLTLDPKRKRYLEALLWPQQS